MGTKFILGLILIITTTEVTSVLKNQRHNRIFGGEVIEPNSYPYNVGLFLVRTSFSVEFCGAALLSAHHILTAAHCIVKLVVVNVHIGAFDRSSPLALFTISSQAEGHMLIPHENFDERTLQNNIGLILTKPFELSESIKPIQLPDKPIMPTVYTNLNAHLVGWGYTEGSTDYSQYPKYAELIILAPNICHHYYSSSITSEIICTDGTGKKGGCKGDEGSPLTVSRESKPILIGIMSFYSDVGCDSRWPTVFTKVEAYLDWIHGQMTKTNRKE